MSELFECVPNFSEGRRVDVLAALVAAARSSSGVRLVDHGMDADHNRAVLTFGGAGDAVIEAALGLLRVAIEHIDLAEHDGVHPRIGAMDVCPFIALKAAPERARQLAHEFGTRAAREHNLPIFFYGGAALRSERELLPALRPSGGQALLDGIGVDPRFDPDRGPSRAHPTAGATAVGVREVLVAFNVDLATDDLGAARAIAKAVRESSGGLPGVRALGLSLPSRGLVQVSMNLCDWRQTNLLQAFEAVEKLAQQAGLQLDSSELIGLAPAGALDDRVAKRVRLRDYEPDRQILERLLGTTK